MKVHILGTAIDAVDLNTAVDILDSFLSSGKPHVVATPNAEIVYAARHDGALQEVLRRASLVVPDGAGLVLAARLRGKPLHTRVAGIDLVTAWFGRHQGPLRVFLLGAKPGVAETAAQKLTSRFPELRIVGTQHGYFKTEDEAQIIDQMRSAAVDVLLVGLGSPRQELFLMNHLGDQAWRVAIGVGGSFDVYAGLLRRAPKLMRRLGLEWLYRLCQEPSRLGRMLNLPRFLWAALWEKP